MWKRSDSSSQISPPLRPQEPHNSLAYQIGASEEFLRSSCHYPYKIQLQHPISEVNITQRFEFANKMLEMIRDGNIDPKRIFFSDEAHFHLDGYVNKQNFRH